MKFLDLNGLKVVLQKLLSKVATAFDSLDYRVENLEGNYLSKKDSAASAKKLDTDAGAENQPVYFENGIPVAIGHTIDSDVPKNAIKVETASVNISDGDLDVDGVITAQSLHIRPNVKISCNNVELGQYSSISFPNENAGAFSLSSNGSSVTIDTGGVIRTASSIGYSTYIGGEQRLTLGINSVKIRASADNFTLDNNKGANTVYTHPTSSGNKHIPSGGSAGQFLKWSSDGTAVWANDNNTWTAFKGATSTTAGTAGYISAVPTSGQTGLYFRSDGSWATPPDTKYTHPTTAGNKHIPTGGSSGQLLGYSASGTAKWVEGFTAITDTELDSMITEVFG